MYAKERDWHETSCPRCGADAQWSFADTEKITIEVLCSDCGRFEIPREEFDQAAIESVELDDRESAA